LEPPDIPGWSAFERLRTAASSRTRFRPSRSARCICARTATARSIKSADPLAPPAIQFNFLASDYDFQALIFGSRLSRKIAAQPALRPFVGEEVIPGAACQTDKQMIAEIRERGVSNLHPVGTCRMGREVDAVVRAGAAPEPATLYLR
jgi:choline dehydrogenase